MQVVSLGNDLLGEQLSDTTIDGENYNQWFQLVPLLSIVEKA
jgi:hypothetical protein